MGLETVRCNQDYPPAPSYVGQILFSCVSSAFLVLLLVSVSHVNSHIVESHKEVHPEERIRKHPARTHIVACFRACVFQRRRGADSFGTSCSPSSYSVLTPPWSVLTQSWYFGSPIVLTLLRTLAHPPSYSVPTPLTHILTLYLPHSWHSVLSHLRPPYSLHLGTTCSHLFTPCLPILAVRAFIFLVLRAFIFWALRRAHIILGTRYSPMVDTPCSHHGHAVLISTSTPACSCVPGIRAHHPELRAHHPVYLNIRFNRFKILHARSFAHSFVGSLPAPSPRYSNLTSPSTPPTHLSLRYFNPVIIQITNVCTQDSGRNSLHSEFMEASWRQF